MHPKARVIICVSKVVIGTSCHHIAIEKNRTTVRQSVATCRTANKSGRREQNDLLALLPPAVALLQRQDPHERFHGVDLVVVDLERFPDRELIAATLTCPPGHA